MKKFLLILVILIVGLPLGFFIIYNGLMFAAMGFDIHFLAIEECLDAGVGYWDDVDNVCRTHTGEQALCFHDIAPRRFPQ